MERWYPVKEVWKKLPWNKGIPSCEVSVIYLDDEIRIMKDLYGSIFYLCKTNNIFTKLSF